MSSSHEDLKERIGNSLLSFELNPPEQDNLDSQLNKHRSHLEDLFSRIPVVGGINLPEIQEEEQKGERGNRESDFKTRVSPREYTRILRDHFNTQFIINRVIVQVPPKEQEDWLLETFHDYGIDTIVVVGGESSEETYPGPSVTEGNDLIKNHLNEGRRRYGQGSVQSTDFCVGNICISTRRREDFDEPDRMMKKLESGCDFFTSQIIAESTTPLALLEDLEKKLRGTQLAPPAILWSITPINSSKDVNFLRWLGVKIPDTVEEKILGSEDPLETSLEHFTEVTRKLFAKEAQLELDIPMGINLSPVAIRNFEPTIKLGERLNSKLLTKH